jgi:hypothetical protein
LCLSLNLLLITGNYFDIDNVIYLLYIGIIVYNEIGGTMKKLLISSYLIAMFVSGLVVSACSASLKQTADPSENNEAVVVTDTSAEVTVEVEPTEEVSIQIQDFISARDYLVAYLSDQYGIESKDPWMEANISPADAAGVTTFRYVSGPLSIVISAEASAPYPASYTIQEASYIANGFYWEGALDLNGEINEIMVVPPWSILDTDQARDAVLAYLLKTYDIPSLGDWVDDGFTQTGNDSVAIRYSSGSWTVLVEFAPAAPLVSSYKVIVENIAEGILWEGDISGHGEITEIDFSQ